MSGQWRGRALQVQAVINNCSHGRVQHLCLSAAHRGVLNCQLQSPPAQPPKLVGVSEFRRFRFLLMARFDGTITPFIVPPRASRRVEDVIDKRFPHV